MSDLESVETKQRVDAAALIRAEIAVASSLAMQVRHFLEMGIVPPEEVSKFEVARDDASRAR